MIKRIKDITLTIQSFEDLLLDIDYPSINSVFREVDSVMKLRNLGENLSFVRLLKQVRKDILGWDILKQTKHM